MKHLTPREACNVAFALITREMDEETRTSFLNELNADIDPWDFYSQQWANLGLPNTGG